MKLTIVTGLTALAVLAFMVELLRRRQLQEKYAILWLLVSIVMLPLAFFPFITDKTARLLGIASGVSLVLFLGIVFLLLVTVHLSWEVSRLEEETRTLAEDLALLRSELGRPRPQDEIPHEALEAQGTAPDDQR
ncbi:DUF2304 domain-containing protein [Dactylosporangium vinaceum]|uniref:DUF2304 domain-containing protein n=1 Tax=Dactylosporangium vinaceum TaxID=53362 RepID=A0ABV5MIU1_9ACTN|nr:DUF2304 domain-containing protein [Dactylosporangium vinaceum]UAB93758.1 DUF2304 domain-containing protein [Dactylosporangium vinaceum]